MSAPWLDDPAYGGMSPESARRSWEAGQRQRAGVVSLHRDEPPFPNGPGDYGKPSQDSADPAVSNVPLKTITPADWEGTTLKPQRWLASGRIPAGDLTILAGNGGIGKTEIAVQLLVYVTAGLADWLGCTIENGAALFLSCEEPENNGRERIERICKYRGIEMPSDLHQHYPDLEETWLGSVDRNGRVVRTQLFDRLEVWIAQHKPHLVVIDSIAAVFDGDAIARRQVRSFIAMLRKIARDHDTAIVLLDHPSVRGMSDGTGTANSVDWRNSVRSMLHLDASKDDQDERTLEVKKSNYARAGEKVTLRWDRLTFTTAMTGQASPYRAAAERDVDELFLQLLDKRNAQGRPVRPSTGRGSAPAEMEDDPDAKGVKAPAFKAAMERLLTTKRIKIVKTGPQSRTVQHLERTM